VTSLSGRQVVITGSGGGLGPAVVDAFVQAGATCHLPVRHAAAATQPGTRTVGGVDLANEASVVEFYRSCPRLWASIHVAGGYTPGRLLETSAADFQRQIDLNLMTAFLCSREAVRNFLAASNPEGRIVNLGSRAALEPNKENLAYAASKAALAMMTRCLADEVTDQGILVNVIAPSIIDTPANRAAMPKSDFTRWPKPNDVAEAILWLASPENRLTSGAVLPVFGRMH
jgi:NAD(P)-dependent dehydrogenase (short-subunit alcohol dehydrogenase family)